MWGPQVLVKNNSEGVQKVRYTYNLSEMKISIFSLYFFKYF